MAFQKFEREKKDLPPRQMYKGEWKCAECGTPITELPFQPDPDRPIYCRDCHQKRRAQFRR